MKKLNASFDLSHVQLIIPQLFIIIVFLTVTVHISAQSTDSAPPEITDLSFSSSIIDTTEEAKNVVVKIRATDNDKGVNLIAIRFRSDSGDQFVNAFVNSQQLISGDSKDGIYNAAVTFPRYSKSGRWKVLEIEARDEANNYKVLKTEDLASFGFPTDLQIISNNEDVIAPEISELKFDSSAVDTTNSTQTVNISVRAIDALSGVRNIEVYFFLPSTNYLISTELSRQQLTSGDENDGVYTGEITFPQGTDSGMWQAAIYTSDSIGNKKNFSNDELAARGLVTQIQVIGQLASSQPSKKSRRHTITF